MESDSVTEFMNPTRYPFIVTVIPEVIVGTLVMLALAQWGAASILGATAAVGVLALTRSARR